MRLTKAQKVDRWIAWWKSRLLLNKWAIIPQHNNDDVAADKNGCETAATTFADLANSECWLNIYPFMWRESADYQHMVIGHELAHIHTQPVKEALDKAVQKRALSQREADRILEDLTNTIAKIVVANARRKRSMEYHV